MEFAYYNTNPNLLNDNCGKQNRTIPLFGQTNID